MLKNKKAIYILIPLNIAIWGYFIYRFYTMYNSSDAGIVSENIGAVKLKELNDSVHYQLSLDYKDPFLRETAKQKNYHAENTSGEKPQKKQVAEIKAMKTPTPAAVVKPPIDIKYYGLVKNNTSGSATALIALNGQSKLIKANDIFEGITFKSFNKDSLVARKGKEILIVKSL